MHRWRQTLILALLVQMALPSPAVFAKEAKSAQADSDLATLIVWHKEEGFNKTFFEGLLSTFAKQKHIDLRFEQIHADNLKATLLRKAIDGDRMPDVAFVPADYVGLYSQLRLSPLSPSDLPTGIDQQALSTVRLNDQLWGAPLIGGNHLMLFYNKKYIKHAARSWDELIRQGKHLPPRVKLIGWNFGEMYWFVAFLGAFGGWPMHADQLTLDTAAMGRALQFYRDLRDQGVIAGDCDNQCAAARFRKGEFAYAINGEWDYVNMEKSLGKDFGVAVLPRIGKRPLVPMLSTHALIFPDHALAKGNGRVLRELLAYFLSPTIQQRFFSQVKRIPVLTSVMLGTRNFADPNWNNSLLQLKECEAMPSHPKMAYAWEAMRKGFGLFMSRKLSAKAATMYMQRIAKNAAAQGQ